MSASAEAHRELMGAAIARDGAGQRALFAGDAQSAMAAFAEAAELYRRSWEAAPPASYGRLVGMLKSAVLAGGGEEQARYATAELSDEQTNSPAAAYVLALASLITGDDEDARRWSGQMRGGSAAFVRTADAIEALARRDQKAYHRATIAIVRDFEGRTDHLTGVAIADTAVMLQRLASRRGIDAVIQSPLLPRA